MFHNYKIALLRSFKLYYFEALFLNSRSDMAKSVLTENN